MRPIRILQSQLGQTPGINPGESCSPGEVWDPETGGCVPWGPAPAPGGGDLPPDFVAPGPTELHEERWDLDSEPCTYTVAYGDTYVGLAKTYLDPTGARWREIWNLNRDVTPYPDPASSPDGRGGLYPGMVIRMPAEACDNMRRWLGRGKPGTNPSELGPDTIGDKARKWWPWALGVAATGAGLWWMS